MVCIEECVSIGLYNAFVWALGSIGQWPGASVALWVEGAQAITFGSKATQSSVARSEGEGVPSLPRT